MDCKSIRFYQTSFAHSFSLRSYTQFAYSQLIVTPSEAKICSDISVSVVVENVGDKEGDEVISIE